MKVKERKFTKAEYKWHINDIFASDEDWEKSFSDASAALGKVTEYKGKLADAGSALACLDFLSELSLLMERLYVYAHMKRDENTAEATYQAMCDRITTLTVKESTLSSYVTPELAALPVETLQEWSCDSKFQNHSRSLDEILRSKERVLSEKEEKLLSGVSSFSGMFRNIFSMFDNADVKFDDITDGKGGKIELSHGLYSLALQNTDAEVRKAAFESMFGAYKAHINTLSQVYAGNVKKDWFMAQTRGFASSLEKSMYYEEVPEIVYKNLISAVDKNKKYMHKYVALRKQALGFDTLNMYDLYMPIVRGAKLAMPYEKAVEVVKTALKPMGSEYSRILSGAFKSGWIDVVENKGKRSGAYSWGVYGTHPFVLLNYQQTVHDVFTIAHELGHAIHSFYSDANQCYEKSGYVIFLAEIASTVNEVLLLKHLLSTATGELRKYLLSYYLDMFRTTLFRQTMFAEFEVIAHGMEERGEPLTAKSLSDAYYELNKQYYGKAVKHNDLIRYEWARIPHFYTSFYVYKYSTGLTSAVTIANNILKNGESAFAGYKKFLSAGGSLPPVEILKYAGVDLTTEEPFDTAMREFRSTLSELEAALNGK